MPGDRADFVPRTVPETSSQHREISDTTLCQPVPWRSAVPAAQIWLAESRQLDLAHAAPFVPEPVRSHVVALEIDRDVRFAALRPVPLAAAAQHQRGADS